MIPFFVDPFVLHVLLLVLSRLQRGCEDPAVQGRLEAGGEVNSGGQPARTAGTISFSYINKNEN